MTSSSSSASERWSPSLLSRFVVESGALEDGEFGDNLFDDRSSLPSVPSAGSLEDGSGRGRWTASSGASPEVPAYSPRPEGRLLATAARLVPISGEQPLVGCARSVVRRPSRNHLPSLAHVPEYTPLHVARTASPTVQGRGRPVAPSPDRLSDGARCSASPRPHSSFSIPSPSGLTLSTPPPAGIAPIHVPPARASSPSSPALRSWAGLSPCALRDALYRAASRPDSAADDELAGILSASGHITPRAAPAAAVSPSTGARSSRPRSDSLTGLPRASRRPPAARAACEGAPPAARATPRTPLRLEIPLDTATVELAACPVSPLGPPPPPAVSTLRRVCSSTSFFAPPPPRGGEGGPGGQLSPRGRSASLRATRHSRPRCPLFRSSSEWRLDKLAATAEAADWSFLGGRKRRLAAAAAVAEERPAEAASTSPPPMVGTAAEAGSLRESPARPFSGRGSSGGGSSASTPRGPCTPPGQLAVAGGQGRGRGGEAAAGRWERLSPSCRVFVESPHKWRRVLIEQQPQAPQTCRVRVVPAHRPHPPLRAASSPCVASLFAVPASPPGAGEAGVPDVELRDLFADAALGEEAPPALPPPAPAAAPTGRGQRRFSFS